MKRAIVSLMILVASAVPALAQMVSQMDGYRNCGPRNLAACQDSNELFFFPWDQPNKTTRNKPKHEFTDALSRFLRGAPKTFVGPDGFAPAQHFYESMVGPANIMIALRMESGFLTVLRRTMLQRSAP